MAEGGPGATQDVVTALRAVPGVADASITPDRRLGGAGTLHLTLLPGADEVGVANAVNRVLREHFGLAVDTDNVAIVDEAAPVRLSAVPAEHQGPLPGSARGWPQAVTNGGTHAAATPRPEPLSPEVQRPDAARADGAPPPLAAVPPSPPPTPPAAKPSVQVDLTEPRDSAAGPRPPSSPRPTTRGARLLIERMQFVAADLGVETEVTLGFSGEHWTGHADGAATPSALHRAVAVATLDAVQQCVEGRMRLELEHLEVPALGSERAVVVEVALVTRRGSERLTGVSSVRDDVRQAVIRATLDALNRRLESVLEPA